MDAGLAAVLGALAGSVATIGAAMATGWAQREGARITARAEHRRERRDARLAIYKDFIAASTAMRDHANRSVGHDSVPATILNLEYVNSAVDLQNEVKRQWLEIVLSGPRSVSDAATKIETCSRAVASHAGIMGLSYGESSMQEIHSSAIAMTRLETKKLGEAISTLIDLAQSALDDDGSLR